MDQMDPSQCSSSQPCRMPTADNVYFGQQSPFLAGPSVYDPAAMYGAQGGYDGFVERLADSRPRFPLGTRHKWFYAQNYGGLQPHYGQQYPDRDPPGLSANGAHSRAWSQNYKTVLRPV